MTWKPNGSAIVLPYIPCFTNILSGALPNWLRPRAEAKAGSRNGAADCAKLLTAVFPYCVPAPGPVTRPFLMLILR